MWIFASIVTSHLLNIADALTDLSIEVMTVFTLHSADLFTNAIVFIKCMATLTFKTAGVESPFTFTSQTIVFISIFALNDIFTIMFTLTSSFDKSLVLSTL